MHVYITRVRCILSIYRVCVHRSHRTAVSALRVGKGPSVCVCVFVGSCVSVFVREDISGFKPARHKIRVACVFIFARAPAYFFLSLSVSCELAINQSDYSPGLSNAGKGIPPLKKPKHFTRQFICMVW